MDKKIITVTSPLLPNLDDFTAELKKIWDSKWITNNGSYHRELEKELAAYLKVPYVSLFTNGTLPLLTARQVWLEGDLRCRPCLRCGGERREHPQRRRHLYAEFPCHQGV